MESCKLYLTKETQMYGQVYIVYEYRRYLCLILFFSFQFFSSMVACFATNFLISAINGDPTKLTDPGLIRFNAFKFVSHDFLSQLQWSSVQDANCGDGIEACIEAMRIYSNHRNLNKKMILHILCHLCNNLVRLCFVLKSKDFFGLKFCSHPTVIWITRLFGNL